MLYSGGGMCFIMGSVICSWANSSPPTEPDWLAQACISIDPRPSVPMRMNPAAFFMLPLLVRMNRFTGKQGGCHWIVGHSRTSKIGLRVPRCLLLRGNLKLGQVDGPVQSQSRTLSEACRMRGLYRRYLFCRSTERLTDYLRPLHRPPPFGRLLSRFEMEAGSFPAAHSHTGGSRSLHRRSCDLHAAERSGFFRLC